MYWSLIIFHLSLDRIADADGNGLIEITALEDLNAMRHSLAGTVYRLQLPDGTFTQTAAGCPTTATVIVCSGYELSRDLDFADAASYRSGLVNSDWMNRWDPIGGVFNANFNGNGYTLRNLHINGVGAKDGAGLFHTIGAAARVENLDLRNVTIEGLAGGEKVGGMAGENRGVIFNSRVINADIEGVGSQTLGAAHIGALVGLNNGNGANVGNIEQSAAYGMVRARVFSANNNHRVGSLVGSNRNGAEIHNSYAVGSLNAACLSGGLVGEQSTADRTNPDDISTIRNSYAYINIVLANDSCTSGRTKLAAGLVAMNDTSDIVNSYAVLNAASNTLISGFNAMSNATIVVTNSYWDMDVYSTNGAAGSGQSSVALQTPTTATGIYAAWSEDDWDFGTSTQYPTLRAADGSPATEVWDTSLLEDITVAEKAALVEDFAPLSFKYKLLVDGIQPPPQIAFNVVSTRSDVSIEIYCDEVRCPLADRADPTTILFATTEIEEIRIVARQSNRIAEYYYTVIYDELTLSNAEAIRVNEGNIFRVEVDYASALADELRWTQIGGLSITAATNISGLLELSPQADLVPKAAEYSTIKFRLEASLDGQVYIVREISARINKVNNGNDASLELSRIDQNTLRVTAQGVESDPDGAPRQNGNILFQRRLSSEHAWVNVQLGNSFDYNLPAETSDYQYRGLYIYEDGQGYLESIPSKIVIVPGERTDDGDSILPADDIDDDNDGLIEIRYLEELDAIRHQLDGSGYRASADANLITRGCPISGCIGYELMGDLDFNDAASYRADAVNTGWTVSNFSDANDSSWQPIDAAGSNPFNAIFKGNGYKIINLQINRSVGAKHNIGLFARIGSRGRVEGLGVENVSIQGLTGSSNSNKNVGGIAGVMWPGSVIVNSYVASNDSNWPIRGDKDGFIGGMVGLSRGYILNSYTDINVQDTGAGVSKDSNVGGMVGRNSNGGKIHNSYVAGDVKGACVVGGLAGSQYTTEANRLETTSEIRNSYVSSVVSVGFGTCSRGRSGIAGGIAGRNTNSVIANTYLSNAVRSLPGNCLPDTSVSAVAGIIEEGMSVGISAANSIEPSPLYSYWNSEFDTSCRVAGSATYAIYYDSYNRRPMMLQNPTGPNVSSNNCTELSSGTVINSNVACTTYEGWSEGDWHFGTNTEYPSVKYVIGLDEENSGCGFGIVGLPQCGSLVGAQTSAAEVLPLVLSPVRSQPQARVRYALNGNTLIAFNAGDTLNLNEGDTLSLDAANSVTEDAIALGYLWRQVSGPTLLPQPVSAVAHTFKVREDLLSANTDSEQAILRLEITQKGRSDSLAIMDMAVMISKSNSGGEITINPIGETLFVASEINDPDGGPFSDISYQWQQNISGNFVEIAGANQTVYRKDANNNRRILLVTTYADGQGYSNTVITIAPPSNIVDQDGNGLIEIASIEQLSAIRHQPDGSGYKASASATLNSEGCPSRGCNGYELVRDLDFNDPDSYSTSTGVLITEWESIAGFTAIFEGNGFTISNLRTAGSTAGLFGQIPGSAELRRIRLANVNIDVNIGRSVLVAGALVGNINNSRITDSHVISGNIKALGIGGCLVGIHTNSEITNSSANCDIENITGENPLGDLNDVGGLVGTNSNNSRIHNSFASGNVIGSRDASHAGGLVGRSDGSISDSYATSNVSGVSNVGGLVGRSNGSIGDSYATSNVSGVSNVGGLVGRSNGSISDSYATGTVEGNLEVGGLVGTQSGDAKVINSFAFGAVRGEDQVGGLVGLNEGQISNSHATGEISARSSTATTIGGLVGQLTGSGTVNNSFALGNISSNANRVGGLIGFLENGRISDSYATGTVQGNSNIGGLVGILNAEIRDSYAIGTVQGDSNIGGLLALAQTSAIVDRSYWSTDSIADSILGSGFSSEVLKSAVSGTTNTQPYFNWNDDNWDFGTVQQYPAIKYNDATCDDATPSENCGKLLSRQRPGLLDIRISQTDALEQPQLSPEFNTMVNEYTAHINSNVIATITATANNPNSLISINGSVASVASAEYSLPSDFSTTTMVILRVAEPRALVGEAVEYRLSFNRFPTVDSLERQVAVDEQSDPLAAAALIQEGYFMTLSGELSDADRNDFSYQWIVDDTQLSVVDGSRLTGSVVGSAGSASLSFYLLEDFIASDQSDETVRVSLMLRDTDEVAVVKEIAFVVRKRNNGTIGAISTPTRVGLSYIAPAIDAAKLAEDPDGAGDLSSIRYQWQQQNQGIWSDIAGATARSYSISSIIPEYYRVIVGYTDGQAYEDEIASAAEPVSLDIVINATPSADTRLSTLTTQPDGTPQGFVFDPASSTQATRYSVELPSDMASTTVTATANNALAMLTIRESTGSATAPSPSASLPVRIGEGEHKEIIIEVTAQSGTTQTYRVIISRASAMDRSSLRFEVELTGISLTADTLTSYAGELENDNITNTVVSASVDIAGVSVQHIRVGDTDYILGDTAQNLTAVAALISKSIPVSTRGIKITFVLRRTDNTADGYTEEDYIITIEASALHIRAKVFLEGPLQ